MPEGVRGVLQLDEDGLHLPGSVAGETDGFVVRTPAQTQDIPRIDPGQNVWPLVTEADFQVPPEDAQNPDLCPDRVRLKKYGEEATEWKVNIADTLEDYHE